MWIRRNLWKKHRFFPSFFHKYYFTLSVFHKIPSHSLQSFFSISFHFITFPKIPSHSIHNSLFIYKDMEYMDGPFQINLIIDTTVWQVLIFIFIRFHQLVFFIRFWFAKSVCTRHKNHRPQSCSGCNGLLVFNSP